MEEDREVPEESLRHFFKAIECSWSVHSVVEESAWQQIHRARTGGFEIRCLERKTRLVGTCWNLPDR